MPDQTWTTSLIISFSLVVVISLIGLGLGSAAFADTRTNSVLTNMDPAEANNVVNLGNAVTASPAGTLTLNSYPSRGFVYNDGTGLLSIGSGSGTGNVSGPASSANNELAVYNGVTGTMIKGGSGISASAGVVTAPLYQGFASQLRTYTVTSIKESGNTNVTTTVPLQYALFQVGNRVTLTWDEISFTLVSPFSSNVVYVLLPATIICTSALACVISLSFDGSNAQHVGRCEIVPGTSQLQFFREVGSVFEGVNRIYGGSISFTTSNTTFPLTDAPV
jgi:hypothetical protein